MIQNNRTDAGAIIGQACEEVLATARAAFEGLTLEGPFLGALRTLVARPAALELEIGDGAVLLVNRATGARLELTESALRLFDAAGTLQHVAGERR